MPIVEAGSPVGPFVKEFNNADFPDRPRPARITVQRLAGQVPLVDATEDTGAVTGFAVSFRAEFATGVGAASAAGP